MELEKTAKFKSKKFAVRIVRLYQYLYNEKKEYVLSKQALCSCTSIGANLAEAERAVSRKDFLSKICIALKERSETRYWLELLTETDYRPRGVPSRKRRLCGIEKMPSATTKTIADET